MFKTRDWLILGPVGALALALAVWGFWWSCPPNATGCKLLTYWGFSYGCEGPNCQNQSPIAILNSSVKMLIGRGDYSSPAQLVIAQYLVPCIALFAAVKLFLLNLRRDLKVALARKSRNHTIVCGLGDTGLHVVENLRNQQEHVVAINADSDSPNAMSCEHSGVPVLKGDATNARTLSLAGLAHAKRLVLTSGDDSTNLEIAFRAADFVDKRGTAGRTLRIVGEMRSDWLYGAITTHRQRMLSSPRAEFKAFNVQENAARRLFTSGIFGRRKHWISGSAPHLVVVGFGGVGREVVAHAAHTAFALPTERPIITIIDDKGEEGASDFFSVYPCIGDNAEIHFIKAALTEHAAAVWKPIEDAIGARPPTAVVICLPDDNQSLFAGLRLRNRLDAVEQYTAGVFIRLRHSRRLGDFTSRLEQIGPLRHRLVRFGDLSYLTSVSILFDDELDRLAQVFHQYYLKTVDPPSSVRPPSQLPWEQLPEMFKHSNRLSADHVVVKLRAMGLRRRPAVAPQPMELTGDEIERMAEMEHWRWLIERRMSGWTHGERDDLRRIHPDLVPWSELGEKGRERNRKTMRDLPSMLGEVGYEIRRERMVIALGADAPTAGARIEAFRASPGTEHLIVVCDPFDPDSLDIAKASASIPHVSVWLFLPRQSITRMAQLVSAQADAPTLAFLDTVEGWVTGEELDLLRIPGRENAADAGSSSIRNVA